MNHKRTTMVLFLCNNLIVKGEDTMEKAQCSNEEIVSNMPISYLLLLLC